MAEEGGKKLSVMVIVGLIVVGLILAGGISYFIATKVISSRGDAGKGGREPGVFMKLGDPKDGLIVNIGGVSSGRYLKIAVVLELKPDKKGMAIGGKAGSPEEIKALDATVQVLRSQKVEDFEPLRQERLKDLIKAEVNKVLGEDRVYEVYITNFVLQ